ncbi:MAG: hypothetical protein ACTSVC_16880 [Promethearchaeota archaeon]
MKNYNDETLEKIYSKMLIFVEQMEIMVNSLLNTSRDTQNKWNFIKKYKNLNFEEFKDIFNKDSKFREFLSQFHFYKLSISSSSSSSN